MKKISFMVLSVLLINCSLAFSQTSTSPMPKVEIGDKMPDYTIKNLINYPETAAKISTFKDKILILDFWSQGCVACFESWPKLLKLQEKFRDDIQIITVNIRNDEKAVREIIKKRERIFNYKMTLPVSCGDPKIKEMFPHTSVPHVIFIDRNGFVRYITGGNELNEETITNLIENKQMKIFEKTDIYAPVDWRMPVFVNGNGGNEKNNGKLLWTSAIKAYSPNLSGTAMIERRVGYSYGALINMSLVTMFKWLYGPLHKIDGRQLMLSNAQVVLKTADTSKLVSTINGILVLNNHYGIQVTAQKEIPVQHLKSKMIAELEDFFGVKTNWETERRKCLVFSRNSQPIVKYETGKRILGTGSAKLIVNNVSVKEFIEELSSDQYYKFPYPIVDDTNFPGNLGNIEFEADIRNYKSLGEALSKYGLSLSIEERDVRVLVVRDDK